MFCRKTKPRIARTRLNIANQNRDARVSLLTRSEDLDKARRFGETMTRVLRVDDVTAAQDITSVRTFTAVEGSHKWSLSRNQFQMLSVVVTQGLPDLGSHLLGKAARRLRSIRHGELWSCCVLLSLLTDDQVQQAADGVLSLAPWQGRVFREFLHLGFCPSQFLSIWNKSQFIPPLGNISSRLAVMLPLLLQVTIWRHADTVLAEVFPKLYAQNPLSLHQARRLSVLAAHDKLALRTIPDVTDRSAITSQSALSHGTLPSDHVTNEPHTLQVICRTVLRANLQGPNSYAALQRLARCPDILKGYLQFSDVNDVIWLTQPKTDPDKSASIQKREHGLIVYFANGASCGEVCQVCEGSQ